ncbi:hypothetical protein AaE_010698, partial [Aphanomyces astaci]
DEDNMSESFLRDWYPGHGPDSLSTIPETSRESLPSPMVVKEGSPVPPTAAPQVSDQHETERQTCPSKDVLRTPTKGTGRSSRSSFQLDTTPGHRRRRLDRENPSPFRPQVSHPRRSSRIQAHLDEATAVLDLIQREKLHMSNVELLAQSFRGQMLQVMSKQRLELKQQTELLDAATTAEAKYHEFAKNQLVDFEQELAELEAEHDAQIQLLQAEIHLKTSCFESGKTRRWWSPPSLFAFSQTWQCLWTSVVTQDDATMQHLVASAVATAIAKVPDQT